MGHCVLSVVLACSQAPAWEYRLGSKAVFTVKPATLASVALPSGAW